MRRMMICAAAISLATFGAAAPVVQAESRPINAIAASDPAIVGSWNGAISLPGQSLQIGITFRGDPAAPQGTIAIPSQGVAGMALSGIQINGQNVGFAIAGVPGEPQFEGMLDGDQIKGMFTQGGISFPFELRRGAIEKPRRPQEPVPPFPYTEEEVTARNGEITLAGTLTRPAGDGPFPAVVLISGSGPQNRDEELFGHRPFAVLADHLSRGGVLVVRYDDRGVGGSTGELQTGTSVDFSRDAEAWLEVLKARGDVASIGLLGHSEGGMIAAMVAARNPDVAFIVMLAGTGVDGAETLVEQNRAIARAGGAPEEMADRIATTAAELFQAIRAGAEDAELRDGIRALAQAQGVADEEAMERLIDAQIITLRSPWFREFIRYDPADDLRKVRVPVLAINGDKDVQVVASQHLPAIESALREAGNTRVTTRVLPGLNHMFQEAATGSVMEYAQIEETMNPAALDIILQWILDLGGRDPAL
jgi:uncharacterized protein